LTHGNDGLDAPITIDLDLLTAGDDEDIETYTGLDDAVARIYAAVREQGAAQERFLAGESDQPPGLFIEYVRPSKLRAALLGVMKRKQDPSFGPQRWRELPYATLLRDLPDPAATADPTQAAETVAPEPSPSGEPPTPTPNTTPPSASVASPPTPPSP
jgi:hypothetical protein